jgi:hypothetical protein
MTGVPYIAITNAAMLAARAGHVSLRNMKTSRYCARRDDHNHTAATSIEAGAERKLRERGLSTRSDSRIVPPHPNVVFDAIRTLPASGGIPTTNA